MSALKQNLSLFFRDPRRLATIAFFIFGLVYFFLKVPGMNAPDLRVFYVAAKFALTSPLQLYKDSPDLFLYPPVASLFFTPLHLLPSWEWARNSWYFFNLILIFLMMRKSSTRVIAGLMLSRYFLINLAYGQINILILSLLIYSLARNKARLVSGVALAFASCIKIFPVFGVVAYVLKRDWRSLALFFGGVVFIFTLPFLVWGANDYLFLLRTYPDQLAFKGLPLISHNQSFTALFFRIFTNREFELFTEGNTRWTLFILPDHIARFSAFCLGACLSFFAFKKAKKRGLDSDFVSASLFSILFCSHLVWKEYLILLFPALIQVIEHARTSRLDARNRLFTWLIFVTIGMNGAVRDVIGTLPVAALDGAIFHLGLALVIFGMWMRIPAEKRAV